MLRSSEANEALRRQFKIQRRLLTGARYSVLRWHWSRQATPLRRLPAGAGSPGPRSPSGWPSVTPKARRASKTTIPAPHHLRVVAGNHLPHAPGDQLGPQPHRMDSRIPRSTVYAVLRRAGLHRRPKLPRSTHEIVRYEHERPGDLVHLDVKKLGRVPPGGGKRFAPGFAETHSGPRRFPSLSSDYLHVAVATTTPASPTPRHSPDERGPTAAPSSNARSPTSPPTASDSSAPDPTARRPTGRPRRSSRSSGTSGPTTAGTPPTPNASRPSNPSSWTTTTIDHTEASAATLPHPACKPHPWALHRVRDGSRRVRP